MRTRMGSKLDGSEKFFKTYSNSRKRAPFLKGLINKCVKQKPL